MSHPTPNHELYITLPIIQPDRTRNGPRREEVLIEHYGPVDIDPSSPMWIGAHAATNNTGELTGVYVAL